MTNAVYKYTSIFENKLKKSYIGYATTTLIDSCVINALWQHRKIKITVYDGFCWITKQIVRKDYKF